MNDIDTLMLKDPFERTIQDIEEIVRLQRQWRQGGKKAEAPAPVDLRVLLRGVPTLNKEPEPKPAPKGGGMFKGRPF